MMDLTAISGALIAGFATGLGALPIYFRIQYSPKTLNVGLGFSAGIMLVASFLSLIIPGIEEARIYYPPTLALPVVLLGLLMGYFFIIAIHEVLPHEHLFKNNDVIHQRTFSRVNLIILAICLHNIPEGLAVGVGFGTDNPSAGMTLAMAIAIQNLPEGLVVAIGLLSEGASKNRAFLIALLSGLIEPAFAFLGYMSTYISQYSLPISLGFAGGTMLFVICQEIFPELFREQKEKSATFGVIAGIITMLSIDYYF